MEGFGEFGVVTHPVAVATDVDDVAVMDEAVERLAGPRHARKGEGEVICRHGSNPGSPKRRRPQGMRSEAMGEPT